MNAIHARSQLRYSPTSVDLEIGENPCETAVMLTWPSRDSQESGPGLPPLSLALVERAVEDFSRSARATKDGFGICLKVRGEKRTKIELTVTVLDKH